MFPMQNFEPESAMISVSSNSALIEKYLRNTCLGQGAVPSKTTHTKIQTLVNQIEDANNNNKPLHLCYIDVKKAYDSVEHWNIKKILTL